MKINMTKGKGFTLVEIIVIMGLLIIIFGLGLRSFSAIEKEDRLQSWIEQVVSSLSSARLQAISGASLSSDQSLPFGVHFSAEEFVLFPGDNYHPSDSRNLANQLPNSLYFETLDLPPGNNIVFQKITGEVSNFDPLHCQLVLREKNSNRRRTITVNKLGVAEINN